MKMPFEGYFSGERNDRAKSQTESLKEEKSLSVDAHDEALFAVERDAMGEHDNIEEAVRAVGEMDTVEDRDAGYAEIAERLAIYETFAQTMKMLSFIEDPNISDEALLRIVGNKMENGDADVAKSFLMKVQNLDVRDVEAERLGIDIEGAPLDEY